MAALVAVFISSVCPSLLELLLVFLVLLKPPKGSLHPKKFPWKRKKGEPFSLYEDGEQHSEQIVSAKTNPILH